MSDVIRAFGRLEEVQGARDECVDVVERAWLARAEKRLQLRKDLFDRIEVGAVGGQEAERGARAFDGDPDVGVFVDGQVIEHHHVARLQRRDEHLFDIGQKAGGVNRAIEDTRRGEGLGPERCDHRVRLPVPARCVIVQPRPAEAPPVAAQEIGGHAALVEKDIAPRLADRQALAPPAALGGDVRTPLLVGVYRFF